ncbi:MAG TPA: hypothetical protein VMB66_03545 [Candidatus Acidoferrales bacterium]|nr:hypothetical protein [Candidatus Acidoferrales bacterium]
MVRALKSLRAIQWSLLASIVLYAGLGEIVRPLEHALDPVVAHLFTTLGVAIVGVIFVVRRTMVFRAEESLTIQPDDQLSLNHWKTGYIATYALCEALALFGLIERFLGCLPQQSFPYYIGGFILLAFFRPRQPGTSEARTSSAST